MLSKICDFFAEFYLFSQILCIPTTHICIFVGLEALNLLVCSDGSRNPGKKFFTQRGA